MKWRGISEQIEGPCTTSLGERLLEIKARTRELGRPENLQIQEGAIADLRASGVAERILPVGSRAPEFELSDAGGKIIRSSELLAGGPLIVTFFRGRWCPYCVATLEALHAIHAKLKELGASLVAISPQTLKQNGFTVDQHKLAFPVLSDPGNEVGHKFGVAYKLPEELQGLNRRIFVNLEFINGSQDWELPMPAVFVIARDGLVSFAEAHADYTQRTDPQRILRHLQRTTAAI
jgi:peroxiredoxin